MACTCASEKMALGPLARDSTYCRTPHRTDDSGAAAASARKPSCNPCSAGGRHHQPSARRRSPSEVCASATRQALGAAAHCPGHGRVCKCHGPCWTMITAVRTSTSGTSTHKPQWTVRWTMSVDGRIGSEFSGQREPAPPPTGRAHHLGGRLWSGCGLHAQHTHYRTRPDSARPPLPKALSTAHGQHDDGQLTRGGHSMGH